MKSLSQHVTESLNEVSKFDAKNNHERRQKKIVKLGKYAKDLENIDTNDAEKKIRKAKRQISSIKSADKNAGQ